MNIHDNQSRLRYHPLIVWRDTGVQQRSITVYTDDLVASAVLDVIRQAKDHVVLVSPYNRFWVHLRNEIRSAVAQGIRVTALVRAGETSDDIDWLVQLGVDVYAVEYLHAKVFMNESTVIVGSMNLLESSSKNSRELALRIEDEAAKAEITSYVESRLLPLGEPVKAKTNSAKPSGRTRSGSRQPSGHAPRVPQVSVATTFAKVLGTIKAAVTPGRCVRCRTQMSYNTDKPLCAKCFAVWSQFRDVDFRELYCHRCGQETGTSYAKPLCRSCYQAVAK